MILYAAIYYAPNGRRLADHDNNTSYEAIWSALKRSPCGTSATVWCVNGERDEHTLRHTGNGVMRE